MVYTRSKETVPYTYKIPENAMKKSVVIVVKESRRSGFIYRFPIPSAHEKERAKRNICSKIEPHVLNLVEKT